jgi:hypothetical protein
MKAALRMFFALALAAVPCAELAAADGAVRLNNYDSNNPLFYNAVSTRLPTRDTFVQVLAGPLGTGFNDLRVLSNTTGQTIFTLQEPGFFDAGVAIVPGVPENSIALFRVIFWRACTSFETALERGSTTIYSQPVGSLGEPALSVMPAAAIAPSGEGCIPEPSPLWLALLGGAVLLWRRRC